MRPLIAIACLSVVSAAPTIGLAQGITVRGVVYDSLHGRPLASALVAIGGRTTSSDSAGRFTVTGVIPGQYHVTAMHDAIDLLGLSAIGRQARVTDGSEIVEISIPSFAGLWRLECGPTPPTNDTGFVFGTVRTPGARRGIVVAASWVDLVARGTTVSRTLRTLEVPADSLGNFALCGVPTSTAFSLRATAADSLVSGIFDVAPLDQERVVRRNLRLVDRLAGGSAAVDGRIVDDSGGGPLANAEIVLINSGRTMRSGERGEFSFDRLGPGTHRISVRKIGYAPAQTSVDLDVGDHRVHDIVLARVTMLDSVLVTGKIFARDEQMRGFDERRKVGLGKFLTAAELERGRGHQIRSLIAQWPSLYFPQGRTAEERDPVAKRGVLSLSGGMCKVAIFLDGIRLAIPLEQVPPESLAGLEYYPGAANLPIEYAVGGHCGVILLHSRYRTGK